MAITIQILLCGKFLVTYLTCLSNQVITGHHIVVISNKVEFGKLSDHHSSESNCVHFTGNKASNSDISNT